HAELPGVDRVVRRDHLGGGHLGVAQRLVDRRRAGLGPGRLRGDGADRRRRAGRAHRRARPGPGPAGAGRPARRRRGRAPGPRPLGGRPPPRRADAPGGGHRRRRRHDPLHLGHDRPPEGRGVHPPRRHPGPARLQLPGGGRPPAPGRGGAVGAAGVHPHRPAVPRDRRRPGHARLLRERVTNFVGVPTQAWDLLQSPRFGEFDTSSLVSLGGGGAPAPPELVRRVSTVAKASPNIGYGMTETNAYGPQNSGEDYLTHPTSAGRSTPILQVEVRDEEGRPVPVGERGEIWFKGPNLIRGYWNRPDATAETIVDGWLRSGDIGRIDEDGFIYV